MVNSTCSSAQFQNKLFWNSFVPFNCVHWIFFILLQSNKALKWKRFCRWKITFQVLHSVLNFVWHFRNWCPWSQSMRTASNPPVTPILALTFYPVSYQVKLTFNLFRYRFCRFVSRCERIFSMIICKTRDPWATLLTWVKIGMIKSA